MSLLVIFDILGLFANTVAAEEVFPLHNRDNLRHPNFCSISELHIKLSTF